MTAAITKDAEKLLCTLYKEYLERRKNGLSKSEANYFDSSDEINQRFFPEWTSDDTSDICWELKRANLIFCFPGDDLANEVSLTSDAIIRMENRFKNGIVDVLKFLSNFIP